MWSYLSSRVLTLLPVGFWLFLLAGSSQTSLADRVVSACCDIRKATVDVQVAFQKVSSGTVPSFFGCVFFLWDSKS